MHEWVQQSQDTERVLQDGLLIAVYRHTNERISGLTGCSPYRRMDREVLADALQSSRLEEPEQGALKMFI